MPHLSAQNVSSLECLIRFEPVHKSAIMNDHIDCLRQSFEICGIYPKKRLGQISWHRHQPLRVFFFPQSVCIQTLLEPLLALFISKTFVRRKNSYGLASTDSTEGALRWQYTVAFDNSSKSRNKKDLICGYECCYDFSHIKVPQESGRSRKEHRGYGRFNELLRFWKGDGCVEGLCLLQQIDCVAIAEL